MIANVDSARGWSELRRDAPAPPRLIVHGDLDVTSVLDFRTTASAIEDPTLVVDLTDCTFVDATGLGALVGGIRRHHEVGGQVVIVVIPDSAIAGLLATTGVDQLTKVVPDCSWQPPAPLAC